MKTIPFHQWPEEIIVLDNGKEIELSRNVTKAVPEIPPSRTSDNIFIRIDGSFMLIITTTNAIKLRDALTRLIAHENPL